MNYIIVCLIALLGIIGYSFLPSSTGSSFSVVDHYIDTTLQPYPMPMFKNGKQDLHLIPQKNVQVTVMTSCKDTNQIIDVAKKLVDHHSSAIGGDTVIGQVLIMFVDADSVMEYSAQEEEQISTQAGKTILPLLRRARKVTGAYMAVGFTPMTRFVAKANPQSPQDLPEYFLMKNVKQSIPEPGRYNFAMQKRDIVTWRESMVNQKK